RHPIEGNISQGISRTLWEEVKFDAKNVTSVDWMTYPILDITETPEAIEVVLINHPELAPTGSGEPSIRPVAAAIANAIFDATGVRIRRVPFSPDRSKHSLSCPGKFYPLTLTPPGSAPSPLSYGEGAGVRGCWVLDRNCPSPRPSQPKSDISDFGQSIVTELG